MEDAGGHFLHGPYAVGGGWFRQYLGACGVRAGRVMGGVLHESNAHLRYTWLKKIGRTRA